MEHCTECGFTYDPNTAPETVSRITSGVGAVTAALRNPPTEIRRRQVPERWSPLEYGCHLRDVLLVQRERVLAALRTERPSCEPMGRDERVEHDGYGDQAPEDVATQLDMAAQLFTNVLSRLDQRGWDRTLFYNHPQHAERTLRWVAVHTLHEVTHHLLDIRRQLN